MEQDLVVRHTGQLLNDSLPNRLRGPRDYTHEAVLLRGENSEIYLSCPLMMTCTICKEIYLQACRPHGTG